MDIKIKGLSFDQLKALEQAREGRHHIREAMLTEISEPRDDYKDHAHASWDSKSWRQHRRHHWPRWKNHPEIQADTNTTISIEDVDGKGMVEVRPPTRRLRKLP